MKKLLSLFSITYLADGFSLVVLPLLAVSINASPLFVTGVYFCRTIPWLLASVPAGIIIDQFGPKIPFKYSQIIRSLVLLFLVHVFSSGFLTDYLPELLLLCSLTIGVAEVFSDNSSQLLVPLLIKKEKILKTNSRIHSLETLMSYFIGPPVAALIFSELAVIGLLSTSLLYLLSFIAFSLYVENEPQSKRLHQNGNNNIKEPWVGISIVMRSSILKKLALVTCVSNFVLSGLTAILPLLILNMNSTPDSMLGYVLASYAVGFTLGSLSAPWLAFKLGESKVFKLSIFSLPIPFLILTVHLEIVFLFIALVILGVGVGVWGCVAVTYRQEHTPFKLLARVNSFYRMISWGVMPIGAIFAGYVLSITQSTTYLLGATILLSTLYYLLFSISDKSIRKDKVFLNRIGLSGSSK